MFFGLRSEQPLKMIAYHLWRETLIWWRKSSNVCAANKFLNWAIRPRTVLIVKLIFLRLPNEIRTLIKRHQNVCLLDKFSSPQPENLIKQGVMSVLLYLCVSFKVVLEGFVSKLPFEEVIALLLILEISTTFNLEDLSWFDLGLFLKFSLVLTSGDFSRLDLTCTAWNYWILNVFHSWGCMVALE